MKKHRSLPPLLAAFLFPLFGTGPAGAALPPLSPEQREAQATLIVTGEVVASRLMTLRKPASTVTFVRLAAKVESVEKGAERVPANQILDIRCRRIGLHEADGPQGHLDIPAEGSRFKMWLRKNPESPEQSQWEPLEPNGIELLDGSPAMTFGEVTPPRTMRDYTIGGLVGIATLVTLAIFLWRRRAVR